MIAAFSHSKHKLPKTCANENKQTSTGSRSLIPAMDGFRCNGFGATVCPSCNMGLYKLEVEAQYKYSVLSTVINFKG